MDTITKSYYTYDNCARLTETLEATGKLISSIPTCKYYVNMTNFRLMLGFCENIYESEVLGARYSKPMFWIGIYIAIASLVCIFLMLGDLFDGFRSKKLWFPSKYFSLNAASITVITVAMKLPVDLNNAMPGRVDQFAKLGSITFMCTMMANFMPSLSSMSENELFANVTGLVILVITMVVNILIQIKTGVVEWPFLLLQIYIGTILYLLVVLISLALTIPTSKRLLEFKYQVVHNRLVSLSHERTLSTVEEIIQHVRRYWVMSETSNPQFVLACTPLCSAAGIICVISMMAHLFVVVYVIMDEENYKDYESDYKWSMLVILITQSIGIMVSSVAPVIRCFAALNFKLSLEWSIQHTKVFHVEKYWIRKLLEWKKIHLPVPCKDPRLKMFVHRSKNFILSVCVAFEKVIVISSKMIGLIPIGSVVAVVYCIHLLKSLKVKLYSNIPAATNHERIHKIEQTEANEDFHDYVLQLQDEMELGTRTLKRILKSVECLIQKAEEQLPNNLLQLLEKPTEFKGVLEFDSDEVQPLCAFKPPNSWGLPVVTLTCIAMVLPNICKDHSDSLFNSVGEGLSYVLVVEKSLNDVGEFKKIRRATTNLWHEIQDTYQWLGTTLQRNSYQDKLPTEILTWFVEKAQKIAVENNSSTSNDNYTTANAEVLDDSSDKLFAATSMYRVAKTIMFNHHASMQQMTAHHLYSLVCGMIADILAACLTNLPRVITMKCHEGTIEKRETNVRAAAKLLGKTKKIIEKLQERELPSLDHDQMPFIDEWRAHMKQAIP